MRDSEQPPRIIDPDVSSPETVARPHGADLSASGVGRGSVAIRRVEGHGRPARGRGPQDTIGRALVRVGPVAVMGEAVARALGEHAMAPFAEAMPVEAERAIHGSAPATISRASLASMSAFCWRRRCLRSKRAALSSHSGGVRMPAAKNSGP